MRQIRNLIVVWCSCFYAVEGNVCKHTFGSAVFSLLKLKWKYQMSFPALPLHCVGIRPDMSKSRTVFSSKSHYKKEDGKIVIKVHHGSNNCVCSTQDLFVNSVTWLNFFHICILYIICVNSVLTIVRVNLPCDSAVLPLVACPSYHIKYMSAIVQMCFCF